MAALAATIPPWIPEDDLLLKNAVEAGASLEALAKGAVRFSRKFTVSELRERWYSLLYDPVVSDEASARMLEFELSTPSSRVSVEVSAKRKRESVRRMYYAMKKKTSARPGKSTSFFDAPKASCGDNMPFDSPAQGGSCIFGELNQNHFGFVGKECYNELCLEVPSFEQDNAGKNIPSNARDRLVDFLSGDRVKEMALAHPLPESSPSFHTEGLSSPLAIWETIEDISAPAMPISVSIEDKGQQEALMHRDGVELDSNKMSLSGMNVVHSGAMLQDKHDVDVLNNSNAISECDYVDLSESLLNFANEDEPVLVDADGKDTIDKFCYDGALLNSPNGTQGRAPDVKESQTIVSDKSLGIPANECPEELESIAEGSLSSNVEQHGHLCSEINLPSSISAANTWSAENCDGEMECTLNSEDTEIPSNDDIFFPRQFASSLMRTKSKEACFPSFSYAKQEQSLMKKEANPAQSRIASQMTRLDMLPVTSPGSQLVGCGVKCESPYDVASRQASKAPEDANQCRTAQGTLVSDPVGLLKAEASNACNAMGLPFYAKPCSPKQVTSVAEAEPVTIDEEEYESDNDIPSYSEIEAMILDMDLCPDDTDSYIDSEVSRYQNEDTRRIIIRLEQCAQSSIQRAIASRGALAVLYGRHLKHYIRETEVILGRATDDMEVDIDLRREGPANKISRQQALIKMEADGSFFLKNLGKILVSLNGKEVATGQSMSLGSNSLIEIGGMAFVFEINRKSVGRHLANATKIRKQNKYQI
ncbi:hypothetical protein P3X46_015921 [Hevea brasiliensis]|uniref:FHA domain-containing protein n=1 Tax=Hevea brasiliensis TaxID=3981 RepID=A0ABQ9LYV8_HEVBR|nr:uncharacterized protein LOC110639565 [Hevea brasiliensis]KAJ9172710.1 hypothetical protein P3X46_015921 [Hevea brasiliensis]